MFTGHIRSQKRAESHTIYKWTPVTFVGKRIRQNITIESCFRKQEIKILNITSHVDIEIISNNYLEAGSSV
jgi:hypothetical protein